MFITRFLKRLFRREELTGALNLVLGGLSAGVAADKQAAEESYLPIVGSAAAQGAFLDGRITAAELAYYAEED